VIRLVRSRLDVSLAGALAVTGHRRDDDPDDAS
jgi:hypothetical protein